ncbi:outer membrane protein [Brevundimonas staleyi]|uniref:Outer membrane protein n=1 Tax=Brevundimonas staleyi TaxID=74326 RepID=A0ABW0G019_9CAUL
MIKTLVAATSVAALSVVAMPAAAQDWSGFYIGGQAGYLKSSGDDGERILFDTNLDGTYNDTVRTGAGVDAFSPGFCGGTANGNNAGAGCSGDDDGAGEWGVRAGYDMHASGGWVLGVVGEWSSTNVKDAVTGFSTTPASYTFQREMTSVAAIRARLGYAMDTWLPYVTAGYARAQVDETYSTSNTANSFTPTSRDTDADGFQIGGGLEKKLTDRFTVGVEYLYSDLDVNDALVVRTGPGTAPATNPFLIVNPQGTNQIRSSDSIELHSFRVTAAFRF